MLLQLAGCSYFLVRVFSQRRIEPSEVARGHATTVAGKMLTVDSELMLKEESVFGLFSSYSGSRV